MNVIIHQLCCWFPNQTLSGTTADFGSTYKQTTAFLEDSKCHRMPWWASSGPGQRGDPEKRSLDMKGRCSTVVKVGEDKSSRGGKLEKMKTWLNLSPSGCLHSHDILKGESGIKIQQATSVTPVRCSPLAYNGAGLTAELCWGFNKGAYK